MIPFEVEAGGPIPAAGLSRLTGSVIVVPIPAQTGTFQILALDAWLMGWSFKETTGSASASAEVYDGFNSSGSFLGALELGSTSAANSGQTPVSATASGGAAIQTATMPAVAGQFNTIQSLRITGLGATAGTVVTATLTGVQGGTINYPVTVPTGATVAITPVTDQFGGIGLQASAVNTAIVLTLPSFGAGNTLESASLAGFVSAAGTAIRRAETEWFGDSGLYVRSGLFLNVLTGSVKGAVYIRS